MVHSNFKAFCEVFIFLGTVAFSVFLGWKYPGKPWLYIPIFILGLVFIGEIYRLVIRSKTAGSPPVETVNLQESLLKPITTTDLVTYRYEINTDKWQGTGLRIAHITDLHVTPSLPLSYYEEVFNTAEKASPDLIFLTGDFFTDPESLTTLAKVLTSVDTSRTYAVLGNHDYWIDPDKIKAVIENSGVRLLTNETVSLEINGNTLYLTGTDYPWGDDKIDVPGNLKDKLHLVLSHNPDNIYAISKTGADCVFSGHYHAGQMRLPLVGPIVVPSKYGRRFDRGHFVINDTHLFVSGGAGAAKPPLRIYCQPDIFIIDIQSDRSNLADSKI